MCYEYSDWAWKARAAELAKKQRQLAEEQKKPRERTEPAAPEAAPETPGKQHEPVPA
jgi:hypothetical protein